LLTTFLARLNTMGLSCCSEATSNNLMLWHGEITENGIDNEAPGVYVDQSFMKSKFQNDAHVEDDVDNKNEKTDSTEVTDCAIRQMLKVPPERPRLKLTSKSAPVTPRGRGGFHRNLSLREKMLERSSNPFHDEFVEEEHEAELYMNALQDSSMQELTLTFRNAESLLDKGNAIHDEVERQGEVVRQSNRDIEATWKDIHNTSHRLKGIKSLRGKFKNIIWHNHEDPEVAVHESDDESVISVERRCTLPAKLPSYDTKMTKQEWIDKGVDQLCHVLDDVEYVQKDIGKKLGEQEKHFQCLDHNIDHIEHKIHHQTKIMNSITKK